MLALLSLKAQTGHFPPSPPLSLYLSSLFFLLTPEGTQPPFSVWCERERPIDMGRYRFKFSDMMPNAWFYKLRDMGKIRNQKLTHPIKKPASSTPKTKAGAAKMQREGDFSLPRNSYYYTKGERFCASPVNLKASDTHFPDSQRRSKKVRNNNGNHRSSKLVSSSVSAGCSCRATVESVWDPDEDDLDSSTENISDHNLREVLCSSELCEPIDSDSVQSKSDELFDKGSIGWSSSCSCRVSTSSTDIILDMEKKPFRKFDVFESPQLSPELELPPILAKPAKFNDLILNIKKKKVSEPICRKSSAKMEVNVRTRVGDGDRISHGSVSVKDFKKSFTKSFREQKSNLRKSSVENTTSGKASSPISQGMKMKIRANSPRLASKKIQALNRKTMTMNSKSRRKSVSESYAVMKSSYDPQRDFRDSMVEMIMEHKIRSSNDLEDLLACYLSLNSNEYHDVIIKVFEQVWFDLPDIRL